MYSEFVVLLLFCFFQLLACAINAGCLAIMNSGLSMRFLVAAVHCMLDKEDVILLDPDEKQSKVPSQLSWSVKVYQDFSIF